MRRDQLFPSKYLKAPDLRGRDVTVTIESVEQAKIQGDAINVVHFENKDKGLIMNVTIYNQISKAAGSEDTDEWAGTKITLYPTTTEYKGEEVDCVRVRASQAARQAQRPIEPSTRDDAPDEDVIPF